MARTVPTTQMSHKKQPTMPCLTVLSIFRYKIPSTAALQLQSFQFDDFGLEDGDTLKVGKVSNHFKFDVFF